MPASNFDVSACRLERLKNITTPQHEEEKVDENREKSANMVSMNGDDFFREVCWRESDCLLSSIVALMGGFLIVRPLALEKITLK